MRSISASCIGSAQTSCSGDVALSDPGKIRGFPLQRIQRVLFVVGHLDVVVDGLYCPVGRGMLAKVDGDKILSLLTQP